VFRSETDHFTAINCDDYFELYKATITIPLQNGFILASDLQRYTACYSRPPIAYTTQLISQNVGLVTSLLNPWGPGTTADFTLAGATSTTVVDLVLTKISYNNTCYSTAYPLQNTSAVNIQFHYVSGVQKLVPLTSFTPSKIKALKTPITYSISNADKIG
jgi:hypothetical protein